MKLLDDSGLSHLIGRIKSWLNDKADKSQVLTNVPVGAKFTDTVYTHPAKHPASVITQDASNRFVSDAEKSTWNAKVESSRVLTDVPANAIFTDTKYTHPSTHPPSIIAQTSVARFVTDAEKTDWSGKETTSGSQTKATTALTDAKTYVDGKVKTDVPVNAIFTDTKYTHPTNHPASVITQDASNRFVSDTEKSTWNAKETPANAQSKATTALNDAKSYVDDKVKTDVPTGAIFTDTKYTHPATHPSSIISQTASARFVTDTEKGYWNAKVESSRVLTDVPANAIFTDTVYTHPAKHPASVITQDASNRFVTDTEKGGWNAKADMSDIPDISGKADITYVDNKVKTDVPANAVFTDTPTDISGKVDKVAGKGLSTNDYTTAEKTKLGNLPKIWIGEEANKGTATDTLYFCYE